MLTTIRRTPSRKNTTRRYPLLWRWASRVPVLKDLTQEQLAAQVGVRRETIMRLEKAQYNPSLKLAIDIARVVEAPIEEIFVFK